MSEPPDVALQLLTFTKSVGRFLTGGERPRHLIGQEVRHLDDPGRQPSPFGDHVSYTELHASVANSLRAGRVVDKSLSELAGSADWWRNDEDGELVPGLRYARNAVEHDGAELIGFPLGVPQTTGRLVAVEAVWNDFQAARKTGAKSYRQMLVGREIALSLMSLNATMLRGAVAHLLPAD